MAVSMYMGKPMHGQKPNIAIDLFDNSLENLAPSYLTNKLNEKIMNGLYEKSCTTTIKDDGRYLITVYDDGIKEITIISDDGDRVEKTVYNKAGTELMKVISTTDPVNGTIRKDVRYDGSVNGIVPFRDATWEEIRIMLMRHYTGAIDLSNYWSVGDTKTITYNAMDSGTLDDIHSGASQKIVILGFGQDIVDGGGRAAVTFGFVNGLGTPGVMHKTVDLTTGWTDCTRREWCNNTFFDALPNGLKTLIKPVEKYTITNGATQKSVDKCFLLSESEIRGNDASVGFKNEGDQYPYFIGREIKKHNNDIVDEYSDWFTRSVSKLNSSRFAYIGADGSVKDSSPDVNRQIVPAFCI